MSHLEQLFAAAAFETYDKTFFNGFGEDHRQKALCHLVLELRRRLELNRESVLQKRHEYFAVPGTTHPSYLERFFEIKSIGPVLAGIRHGGSQVDFPFVSIWPGFEIQSMQDLNSIYNQIKPEFMVFRPKYLGIWLPPKTHLVLELEKKIRPKLRCVAGVIGDLKKNLRFDTSGNISLERIYDNSYRSWYEDLYRNFHNAYPEWKTWIPMTDLDEMNESISSGLMYFAKKDGKRIGVISGKIESLLGIPSVYICELAIVTEYRGQGFAAEIQGRFIDSLPNNIKIVWGTIDAGNVPSTKAAQRLGRRSIRNEYFVPVELFER